MKKCILIHIHDGKPEQLRNGDYMLVERFHKAEKELEQYLAQGYEVKQMVPSFSPAVQKEGCYSFYKDGITFYLEKTVSD